ncbi:MAG: MASE1 domain-containing protein, partial [Myxococcales bacterium]|nr:MASE1 domain-containing protein [Myxococcales bacterium]
MRALGQSVLLAAVYAVVAKACLALDAVSGFATLVWPPTGISLVAVLMLGPRVLPGVFAGAFVANLWSGAPVAVALGIGAGNALEAVAGALALRRFATPSFRLSLARVGNVLSLIAFAAVGSTLVSATIGVLCLRLGGVVHDDRAVDTWLAWWVGDGIGDLVVAPALLVALAGRAQPEPWHDARPVDVVGIVERVLL